MAWRRVREFNDRTLALVLERRFPKVLGDRLITAVELADPKLAKKYGFSQLMLEKTIQDAADSLKTLPVSNVFNWGRLYKLWTLVGLATVGVWLLVMASFCVGSVFAQGAKPVEEAKEGQEKPVEEAKKENEPKSTILSPYGFAWRFMDVAAIWGERNVSMMNTYWPPNSHLEIEAFQPSKEDPNDMHIPRGTSERPDLLVARHSWVIADRDAAKAPRGWRPLTWHDLGKLIDKSQLDAVAIPADFGDWQVDVEELEPNLVEALLPTAPSRRRAANSARFSRRRPPGRKSPTAVRPSAGRLADLDHLDRG